MDYKNQIVRLVKILQLLSYRNKITTKDIQKAFDDQVSLRTIQRDMLKLSESNIPLTSETGPNNVNVWSIDPSFRNFIPFPLNNSEYMISEVMKKSIPVFRNTPLEEEYIKLLNKIDQLIPPDIIGQLNDVEYSGNSDNVKFLEFGTYDYTNMRGLINNILESIINKKISKVKYFSINTGKVAEHEIEPYKILVYKGGLYLIGYREYFKEFNHFAIHRIEKYVILGNTFIKDKKYSDREFVKSRFGLSNLKPENIVLQIDKEIVPHIEGRFWHPTQKVTYNSNGNIILEMKAGPSEELISWIFSWRGHIKIIEPESLKKKAKQILKFMSNTY